MKKIISLLLSAVMLVSSLFAFSFSAQAATIKNVPVHKVGDKFTITLKIKKTPSTTASGWKKEYYNSSSWKQAYYAKFKPTADGLYEFAVKGEDFYGQGGYQALIVDEKDEVVSYAYAIGEDSFNIDLVGNLKKGKTYYYLVRYFADFKRTVKLNITLKKHKHSMIDVTKQYPDADYLIDYGIDSEEPVWICKIQGCGFDTRRIYYSRYYIDLARKSYTYDGKEKKPKVQFFDMRQKAFSPEEWGIDDINLKVKYENNINVGKAKAEIRTQGLWQTLTFKINPQGTELKKLSAIRGGFKAKWKKQPVKTSGYQLQYSRYKSFKKAKKITVKGNKKLSKQVKKLSRHKKYYVRVRTYKTVDGKKYYSKWSKAKTVKTK